MAVAAVGWTGNPFIIKVTQVALLVAWSLIESKYDMDILLKGNNVPIFKTWETWITDKFVATDMEVKIKSYNDNPYKCFTYYDYLRLFLLLQSEDKTLLATKDLIYADMDTENGYDLSKHYTTISVDAKVSIKYLFMTQAFMVLDEDKKEENKNGFFIDVKKYKTY